MTSVCPDKTSQATIEYPFYGESIIQCANATVGKETYTIAINFSSDAKFFVATGVLSLLYCGFIIVVYLYLDELYRSKSEFPIADFMLTTVLAVFWLSGSSAWANGTTGLKQATDATEIAKICGCPITTGTFSGLHISLILGFLNFFLWASDLWFLFKETIWFGTNPAANQQQQEA